MVNVFFSFSSPPLTSVTRKSMTIAFRAAGATRAALCLAAHSSREMVRSSAATCGKSFFLLLREKEREVWTTT